MHWKELNQLGMTIGVIGIVMYGVPVLASMSFGWPANSLASMGCGVAVLVALVALAHTYNRYVGRRNGL